MLQYFHPFGGVDITFQVMAIPQVSAEDGDAVEPESQTLNHKDRVHPPGTHGEQRPDIGRILAAGYPGQVGSGVGTPSAKKSQNFRLIPVVHISLLRASAPKRSAA
jgi:hypothetical protein